MGKKVIIIGGVASGMTVASNLVRRGGDQIELVVYEARSYTSLGACGIPFYIGGYTPEASNLIARSAEKHIANGINVKVLHKVIKVDVKAKKVTVLDLTTNKEFDDYYDELVIATGARPRIPNWPGINLQNVFGATTLEDAIALRKKALDKSIQDVVIIGGGFIGVELGENFFVQGSKKITIIEHSGSLMSKAFDPEMSEHFTNRVRPLVNLKMNEKVKALTGTKKVESVTTNKGTYKADLVIVAIGFLPNSELFKGQLKLDESGAIVIDDKGLTSDKNVYSAGDCATIIERVSGENIYRPLATTARKMGKIVANNLLGQETRFFGTLGSFGVRFSREEIFATGLSETQARSLNISVITATINASDAAGYSGQARPLMLKLVAKEDGTIIGAQALGENKSPALRIALLIGAVWNGMSAEELSQIDFFYTPPFSSATDIVLIAASQIVKKSKNLNQK